MSDHMVIQRLDMDIGESMWKNNPAAVVRQSSRCACYSKMELNLGPGASRLDDQPKRAVAR
jgi:hypothetical protein